MKSRKLKKLRRKIIHSLPFGESLWQILCLAKNIFKAARSHPGEVGFFGWDMFTPNSPPWAGDDKVSRDFNITINALAELVGSNKFTLSIFADQQDDTENILSGLRWRHYNIFWSVKYAIN